MVSDIKKQGILAGLLFITITMVNAEVTMGVNTPSARIQTKLLSYSEIHQSKLIRQGWDTSCGAAAMAIVFTFHHLKPVSEAAIALTLLKNTDPDRVRERGGFSLLDLKQYAEAVGYIGSGFGGMALTDLKDFALPAILPVRIRGFDHFVVYRKQIGDRVLIGDPAFGNLILKQSEFEEMWQSRIAFYVLNESEQEYITHSDRSQHVSPMSPQRAELAVPDMQYNSHLIHRLPIVPITRQIQRVIP